MKIHVVVIVEPMHTDHTIETIDERNPTEEDCVQSECPSCCTRA